MSLKKKSGKVGKNFKSFINFWRMLFAIVRRLKKISEFTEKDESRKADFF